MKTIFFFILLSVCSLSTRSQILSRFDPDSLMAEWLETGVLEEMSLHPDMALDWLLDMDSSLNAVAEKGPVKAHLFTVGLPARASVYKWAADSGEMISPVSMKYRLKMSEPRCWEFRLQANHNAGDTCLDFPGTGVPEHLSSGFLIRTGLIVREIIIGDYQFNSGFGTVTGTSPVFSLSLGNPGSLHRAGKGIRLHSGTSEGRFFRGIAGRMVFGKSELVFYGSGKDLTNEGVAGLSWKRTSSKWETGFSGIRVKNQFPPAVREGWTAVWQPDSGRFGRIGIWGQSRVPFGILFGEAGWSPDGGYGWVTGIRWFEAHGFSAVFRYSGCTPGYPVTYSLYQSGTGMTREGQRWIVSFSYAPSRKFEWLGSAEVNLSDWPGSGAHFGNPSTRLAQQIKYISKGLWTLAVSSQIDFQESGVRMPEKLTWKLAFDSDPKQAGKVRFRAGFRQQVQAFGLAPVQGTTADCSLTAVLTDRRFRITGGFRVFTTDTGTDPLYAYEPDVLYGWSAPVLSGSGTRWYATIRWKLSEAVEIEMKIDRTAYSDLKHLSAGNKGGLGAKVQVAWEMGR